MKDKLTAGCPVQFAYPKVGSYLLIVAGIEVHSNASTV